MRLTIGLAFDLKACSLVNPIFILVAVNSNRDWRIMFTIGAIGAGGSGWASASPYILICRKFEQNPWKSGHGSFDTFVSYWVMQWAWLNKKSDFFSKKFVDLQKKVCHQLRVLELVMIDIMNNQLIQKLCRGKVYYTKIFRTS